jgi:hypothetical protein
MDGFTSERLVMLATCANARPSWDLAFRLLLIEQLPGILESSLEVSTFRVMVLLNQYQLITINRVNTDSIYYSFYLEIPFWINNLTLSIWQWIEDVIDIIPIDLGDGNPLDNGDGDLIEFL